MALSSRHALSIQPCSSALVMYFTFSLCSFSPMLFGSLVIPFNLVSMHGHVRRGNGSILFILKLGRASSPNFSDLSDGHAGETVGWKPSATSGGVQGHCLGSYKSLDTHHALCLRLRGNAQRSVAWSILILIFNFGGHTFPAWWGNTVPLDWPTRAISKSRHCCRFPRSDTLVCRRRTALWSFRCRLRLDAVLARGPNARSCLLRSALHCRVWTLSRQGRFFGLFLR